MTELSYQPYQVVEASRDYVVIEHGTKSALGAQPA